MILKNKKGFILVASYMVIVVLIILGASFVSRNIGEMRIAEREKNFVQAFYLAEAGIDEAFARLRAFHSAEDPGEEGLGAGAYDYETIDLGEGKFRIVSTGSVGDINRTVTVEVQEDTYGRYLYFTDDEHFRWRWWRIPVWFITDDQLGGPLQTNSHLHISGSPVFTDPNFHQPVKTADSFITYMHGGPPDDNPDFQEGIQLGAEVVPMPSKALGLRTAAVQEGLMLTGPTTIVLNSDGTMDVTNAQQGWVNENMPLPANGALFVNGGDLTISGILNGRLSVGSNRNIVIANNLVYNQDPRVNPDSTDTLGLIAERDVVVSRDAPFDVEIDGSIMGLGNSFTVERWWQGPAKVPSRFTEELFKITVGP
jgi:type II secretory pathway pseudopilin PulG